MSNRANLANGLLATQINNTQTYIDLQSGYVAGMPAAPFFVTITPFGQLPTMGNSEIVQVVSVSGDRMNIVRAQKKTAARSFSAGSIVTNSIYADDIGSRASSLTAVQCDVGNYGNTGSNKARMKRPIHQHNSITIDTNNNEIVIGDGVECVKVTADIMAEGLSTYLFIIIQHRRNGQSAYSQVVQSLSQHNSGYAGCVVTGVLNVSSGDRIAVLHDCSGQIRGQFSQVIVEQC